MKNFVWSPAVVSVLTITCFSEGTIWEIKEDVFERFQHVPPLRETRKYFLYRQSDSRGKRYTLYYDIIFILDSSASIWQAHFNLSLITARNLVTRFAPDTQFAVTFATNATVNFEFNSSRRVLLVTDGPCERNLNDTINLQRLIWVTMQIKTLGSEVFVFAVGRRIPRIEELLLMPSSTDAHFYRVANMAAFKRLVDGIATHIVYQDTDDYH